MSEATSARDIRLIAHGEHSNPFSVLGLHRVRTDGAESGIVRAFVPWATKLAALFEGREPIELERIHPAGFFVALVSPDLPCPYRLRARDPNGSEVEFYDPYSFGPTLGELDLHLLGEGTDLRMYHKLGAHPHTMDGVSGVRFAVWAPNAQRVSVV